jgi:protein-S-isoprenylcysteine O-methyltransferase Ste14
MSAGVLTLFLLDFALIAALPRIFFKQGSFNLLWMFTGAPYLLCACALVLSFAGHMPPLPVLSSAGGAAAALARECFGAACAATSLTLMGFVLGTHQKPLALWHQKDDAPEHIVTHGAYARIRHPFYCSFLTALVGGFVAAPSWGTAFTLAYGFAVMQWTAKKEEAKLLASKFGTEYEAYMKRTGRFFPYLGALPAPEAVPVAVPAASQGAPGAKPS